jgi:DNA-binding TFAR19-related protein (PDSD5 family)
VSYPDVRNRLNSVVIARIESANDNEESSLVNCVRKLAIEEKLDLSDAKQLLEIYNHETEVE